MERAGQRAEGGVERGVAVGEEKRRDAVARTAVRASSHTESVSFSRCS